MMGVILILIALTLLVYFIFLRKSDGVSIKSSVDGNVYLIRMGSNKSQEYLNQSANTLADINKRVEKLIQHIDAKYKNDNSKNYFTRVLKEKYSHNVLSEAAIDKRYTTYTIDKDEMHICLRTRDTYQKVYDINLLMYVVLHELAHLCNFDIRGNPINGHGNEFKNIFKFLVYEASAIGVYKYTNYLKKPAEYCGIIINSTILPEGF